MTRNVRQMAAAKQEDTFTFDGSVVEWEAKENTFFVHLPLEMSEEISVRFGQRAAGFGSIKVEVTIAPTTWQTSLFPNNDGRYALPLKKLVRDKAGLEVGSQTTVTLRVIA